ncbi:hypothetical protein HK100_002824, partial [Physocladia obscura]
MLPLALINVLGLTLNTLCLRHVDASFYQVARALVLPFTVVLSRVALGVRISVRVGVACALVFAGFLVGTAFENKIPTLSSMPSPLLAPRGGVIALRAAVAAAVFVADPGTLLGIVSSLSTAVHAIVIKKSLGLVGGSAIDLVYYNNYISAIFLAAVVVFSGEIGSFRRLLCVGWRFGCCCHIGDPGIDRVNYMAEEEEAKSQIYTLVFGGLAT